MSMQGIQQMNPRIHGVTCNAPIWEDLNKRKNIVLIRGNNKLTCSIDELLEVLNSNEDVQAQLFELIQTSQIVETL